MKSTDVFLLTYAALAFSTVFILSILSVEMIDVYVALFAIEFFIASELISPLGGAESRRKTIISIFLLVIFTAIIIERIAQILG
jgi:hypothetical protein